LQHGCLACPMLGGLFQALLILVVVSRREGFFFSFSLE